MAQVDEHSEAVHLPDDFLAELRQAAQHGGPGAGVGPRQIRGMGQRHVLRAEDVQRAQRRQRVVDRVAALNANQRSDTFGVERALDVRGCVGDLKCLGPPHGHAMDDVDLFEGCPHGFIALHARRHIDRPELAADAALAQTRNVGHQFRHRLRNVGLAEVAARIETSQRPWIVVVPVDDGRLPVDRARPLGIAGLGPDHAATQQTHEKSYEQVLAHRVASQTTYTETRLTWIRFTFRDKDLHWT